jgi:hypothetical protein
MLGPEDVLHDGPTSLTVASEPDYRRIVLSTHFLRTVKADTRAVLNSRTDGRPISPLASRVEAICHRVHVTLADADTVTAETLVRAGGPSIYIFRSCSSCGRSIHWVTSVGVSPGRWTHNEPASQSVAAHPIL